MPRSLTRNLLLAALAASMLGACGDDPSKEDILGGEIEFEPERPNSEGTSDVEPYTGDNQTVLAAQERFRTPLDLQSKVIQRTCGPTGGVCHNQKEYPDLHTPANFLSTVGAPCNVQPGEWESVYDRCERPGDRFKFQGADYQEIEIGHIQRVQGEYVDYREQEEVPTADSPGLHVYLATPIPVDRQETYETGQFIRTFVNADGNVQDLAFANFRTRWWILDGGTHLMAEVRDYQVDNVNELLSVGIEQGDLNRNGTYGARETDGAKLLDPGSPETSYLIARLRGKMEGETVPGTRMPLANQPLSVDEMLALFCFVEQLPANLETTPDGTTPIDYKNCSYSEDPESLNLLGDGVSWSGRVKPLLEANCGGCHAGEQPLGELNLIEDDAYTTVLGPSTQKPDMNLVEPGSPEDSYLWLKIIGDESIEGQAMPINPIDGESTLSEGEMADIKTWIENGAIDE
ncbi:MAG: c-type cytochrome domain-containing protein [Myxococcota bacterium]